MRTDFRRLIRYKAKKSIKSLAGSWLAAILLSLFASGVLNGMLPSDPDSITMNGVILDFLFVLIIPYFGSLFLQEYWSFQVLQDDTFTRELFFLRTLPISCQTIVNTRFICLWMIGLVMGITFFLGIYLFSQEVRAHTDGISFLWFSLIWMGFSLLVGGIFPLLELGTNGKGFFWFQILLSPLFVIPIIGHFVFRNQSIVEWTLDLAQHRGGISALVSFLIGSIGLLIWRRLTLRTLEKRNITIG